MLGLGPDRAVFRIHLQRRLLLAGAHPARPRHPRRLRPAEIGDRETVGARAPGAARHGDDGLEFKDKAVMAGQKREARLRAGCPGHPRLPLSQTLKTWMAGTRPGMT